MSRLALSPSRICCRSAGGCWLTAAEHFRKLVACDADVVHAEFLRVHALGEEVLDTVGGVGEPGGQAGEEGSEEAGARKRQRATLGFRRAG